MLDLTLYPFFWLPLAISALALWIMQSHRIMRFMIYYKEVKE